MHASYATSFPSSPPRHIPSVFVKPIDIPSLLLEQQHQHNDIQSPLLTFPSRSRSQASFCVNVVPVDAPRGDPDPFNSRSFCAHAHPICVTGRTSPEDDDDDVKHDGQQQRKVGILHLSKEDMTMTTNTASNKAMCHAATPALRAPTTTTTVHATTEETEAVKSNNVSSLFPISCDGLACAVRCAHGAHDAVTDKFPTCADIVPLTDEAGSSSSSAAATTVVRDGNGQQLTAEWLPSDDEILIVVPAYPFQGNIFHFAQTVVPLFHSASTLLSSTSTSSASNVTLLFRGQLPSVHGQWQTAVFNALLSHSGFQHRVRLVDTLREDDISLVRAGLLPSSALLSSSSSSRDRHPRLGRTVCARGGALLLGHRTHVNMWPFPGGNRSLFWPFNDNPVNPRVVPLTVPATALHTRAAVYNAVELPGAARLTHVLRKAELTRYVRAYAARMQRKKNGRGGSLFDGVFHHNGGGGKWGKEMSWTTWFALLLHPGYRSALNELKALKRLENDPDFDTLMAKRDSDALSNRKSTHSPQQHQHQQKGLPLTRAFFHAPFPRRPRTVLLDLPGRVLVYARRDPASTRRAFCCGSSSWVDAMLERVAARHGFSLRVLELGGGISFAAQLAQVADAGVIVGLHGANLVNSMFAPPLAALVEVANMHMQCYIGGMNAGLAYWNVKPEQAASRTQSGCERAWTGEEKAAANRVWMTMREGGGGGGGRTEGTREDPDMCMYNPNWRAVKLGPEDRFRLEKSVTQAVQYVLALHGAFAKTTGAVPVVYKGDDGSDEYEIDWSRTAG